MPFPSTWMDSEIVILRNVRQRNKYHRISFICGILKKNWYKLPYLQNRDTHLENKLPVTGEKGKEG